MTADASSNLLKPSEVAKLLRVSTQSVLNWIERGALPAVSLPHLPDQNRFEYRVHLDWLRDALEGPELPAAFLEAFLEDLEH